MISIINTSEVCDQTEISNDEKNMHNKTSYLKMCVAGGGIAFGFCFVPYATATVLAASCLLNADTRKSMYDFIINLHGGIMHNHTTWLAKVMDKDSAPDTQLEP